ncbi:oligosaccharide flippase family protein [Sinomonas susongensis]|uniref:oligosaccharide flippase family protein n=1 Tax=Sinomonas susongensis TaxID=1324851 RepID=UPI002482F173|nr:oligosaccharide flippase family protein [Sinomonas susongensis]
MARGKRRDSSVGSGALWSGINTLVMRVANVAIMVVAVRLVSPRDFGVFTAALVVGTIATSMSELGVASALIRRDLSVSELGPTVVTIAWVWSGSLAIMMVAGARPLADLLGAPDAETSIRVLALGVAASGFSAVPGALLARDFRQRSIFTAGALAFVPSSAVLVLLAFGGSGPLSFAWSKVVTAVVTGAVMLILGKQWVRPRFERRAFQFLLRFGVPLAAANVVGYALLNADFALVGHAMGPALLGVYSVAFSIASLAVSILSSALNSVAMPAFSNHAGASEGLRGSLRVWGSAVFFIGLPVCGFTSVFSREVVSVLYGHPWAAAGPVVAVLALYGVPMLFELMLSNLLVAIGRTGAALLVQCVWIVALSLGMLIGLNTMGLVGVGWAHVVVLLAVVIPVQVVLVRRLAPGVLQGLWQVTGRPLVGTCLAAISAFIVCIPVSVDWLRLSVGGVVGGVVYLGCTRPLWRDRLLSPRSKGNHRREVSDAPTRAQ